MQPTADAPEARADNDIAIVSVALRVPGAQDAEQFWQNVCNGVESVQQYTEDALLAAGVSARDLAHPHYVRAGAPLEGMEQFDAELFGFGPKEAAIMDPQHRHFLEVVWEALERAAYVPGRSPGAVGVFAGCGMGSYFARNILSQRELVESVGLFLLRHTGNDKDFLATRASYCLDLHGPSVNVQTACSTSLVAVHLACQSLLSGECDLALAGGVTIELPHRHGYVYHEGEVLSPDGHCRPFDARAQGTVFGSGAGVVALRRLSDAREAGDPIIAVIKGSAVNNDGSRKVGYLAPSVDGQAAAIGEALALANVRADSLGLVECHGTGTAMGDPIEIAALTEAFAETSSRKGFCAVGSVKSNIGHLDTAAGVVALIKAALALQHRQLPPTINFERPNEQIAFKDGPFYVNDRLRPWPAGKTPRRAGVNSLGVGGTNAYVILEEPPLAAAAKPALDGAPRLLVLSARNARALAGQEQRLLAALNGQPELGLDDVAHTLFHGRKHFDLRRVLVARDKAEACAILGESGSRRAYTHRTSARPSVVFMFPGGGAQYPRMGQGLLDSDPVFREHLERGLERARTRHGLDLRAWLLPADTDLPRAAAELERPSLQVPLLFITEYALAQSWLARGITPAALIGHSLGENTAACVAGVMDFDTTLGLAALRGRLFESLPPGGMLSVPLPAAELRLLLPEGVVVACENAPSLCVASGPRASIDALAQELATRELEVQPIRIQIAAHSPMLEPILAEFEAYLRRAKLSAPKLPIISNLTGQPLTAAEATDPTYWVRQLRNTVRFAAGIETLESAGPRIYLEVGPGRALGQLVRQCLHSGQARAERTPISSLRHPDEAVDDAAFQLAALGRLWASGAPVDLAPVLPKNARRVRLPTYAFDHQPYFIAEKASEAPAAVSDARAALDDWFYAPVWQPRVLDDNQLDPTESQTYLLFADDLGIADRLAQQLRAAGHRPIFVRKSEAYGQTDLLEYEVSPGASHSYETLVQELTASEKLPTRIVHLWGVNAEAEPSDTWVYDSARRTATFDSLFHLLRALTAEGVTTPMQLTIVTSGAQRLLTEPLPHPEKALVQGLCAVMPHEAPHLTLRWVDVPPPRRAGVLSRLRGAPPDDAAALVRDLEREARARDAHTTVAYRGGQRFERDLLPTPLTAAESARSLLRTEGVYMITGGLGGIGLTLAEALVREHRARVCLVARRRLPERVEWERLVTSPRTKPELARTLLALLALEQLGADYTVITADVADHEQMQRAFDHAQARFGSVHGVFHAAGVLEDRLLARKTREEAERVLSPKLDGTWVLHQLAQRHGVELLVLFGSTSSWLGAPGQSDYAAANAFLEAYTQSRRGQPGPHTITIQWGVWRDVGMAVNAAARGDHPTPAAGSGGAAVALPPRGTPSTDAATEPREVRPQSDVRELAGARGPEERLPRSQGHARSHRDGFFDDAAAQSAADGSLVLSGEHNAEQAWWLDEHRMLDGTAVMPGTGYLQLMAAAWQRLDQARPVEIRQAAFLRPLAVIDNASASVRVQLRPEAGGFSCEITSHAPGNEPEIHASAQLMPLYEEDPKPLDLDQIRARCQLRVQREPDGITTAQEAHLRFGPRFRSLRAMYVGDREALGELALDPRFTRDVDTTPLHAGLLDIGTGFALPIVPGYDPEQGLWAPLSYTRLALHAPLPARCAAWVRVHERAHATQPTIAFDVTLTDEEGRVCVVVEGLTVRKLPRGESLSTRVEVPERSAARPARAWAELAFEQNLALGISAREGLQALSRIVRGGAPAHVMVSPRNPYALRHALSRPEAAADSGGARFARPELSSEYVAPSDPLHVELASMWQALLGVEGIGIRDDFFELGGHSLTAVRLSSAVKKQLGVELGLATLFEAPTIERMAELLAGDVNLAPAAPRETGDATAAASGNVKSVNRREFTPLVPIKPRGEQRPLFCAAGQGGNPMHLRTLAHYLGAQRPFYGLQHRGLDGHSHPYASVEEMASDYVRHIMQVESGPYLIAGYSGGGTAAFEMARQLRAAGQQVEALILLDSFCPLDPEPGLAWRLRAHLTGLRSEGVAYARRRVAVRLRDKRRQLERKLLGQPNVSGQSRSMFETAAANWQNIEDRYAAKPLDERAYLFRVENPSTDDARYFERRYNGWNQLLRAGVQQVIVPGTHVSMCEEPNVQTLAQRVREVLDALDDASRAAQ